MASTRNRYLAKNILVFMIGNFATKFINFFMVPLYTHALNTAEYGVVDLITTIGNVIAPILMLNLHEGVLRFNIDKDADNNKIMSIGYIAVLFSFAFGGVFVPFVNYFEILADYKLYVYFYTITLGVYLMFSCYLRGIEKLKEFSICNVIVTVSIASLCIFFLVYLKIGVKGYFLAYIISHIIGACYSFFVGKMGLVLRHFNYDSVLMKEMFKYSVILIPNTFMWWIINSSDRIMVTKMIGVAANGIYAISYKLPSAMQNLTHVANQAWSYSAIRENGSDDEDEYNNQMYRLLVVLVSTAAIFLILIVKPFLKIYVEKSYYTAWEYTPFLAVGFAFLSLASFLGTQYTVYKDSKAFLISSSIGAAVNLLFNYILIKRIGVNGAALATCLSFISVFVYRAFDTKRYIKVDVFSLKNNLSYALLTLACFTVYLPLRWNMAVVFVEFAILILINLGEWKQINKKMINYVKSKK